MEQETKNGQPAAEKGAAPKQGGDRQNGDRQNKVGLGKLLLWNSRSVSAGIIVLIMGFLMIYCTDTLMMPAALVSALLIGSKLVDGVTDAVAGFIVDKTKTKWGKGRPYEVFIIGAWLCTWLLFSCPPGFQMTAKAIWIFMMYVLVNAVCQTFLNANGLPYTVRVFRQEQIVKVTSYGSIITMLCAVAFNIGFPIAMAKIAVDASGWSRLVLMLAVPLAAIGILRFVFFRETLDVDVGTDKEKLKVSDVLVLLKTDRYVLLFALMQLIFSFVCNMGVNVYYFKYIVGNIGLMSALAVVQIVAIPLALLFPKLIAKFSTVKLMIAGFFLAAIGYLLNVFAGSNMVLLAAGAVCYGAGTIPASMLTALVLIECADFNEWKGIHRMEGTMSSITGLAAKVGAALGSGVLGVLLTVAGFTGDAATMPGSAYMMIRLLFGVVPMVLYVLTAVSLMTYRLNKQLPQFRKENEERRAAARTQE